ncbi:MAG: hypothetical protein ACRYE8_02180 [Janthinobacterium lividum]
MLLTKLVAYNILFSARSSCNALIKAGISIQKENIIKKELNHYRLRAGRLMIGTRSAVKFKLKLIPI